MVRRRRSAEGPQGHTEVGTGLATRSGRRWAFAGMVLLSSAFASLGGCRTEEERRLPDACEGYLAKLKRCGGGPAPEGMRDRLLLGEADDKKLDARCKSASQALASVCP